MPAITRFIGETVAVMTECNKLVKVEFSERSDNDIELRLVHVHNCEPLRGYGKLTITSEQYKARPWQPAPRAAWALDFFGLQIKKDVLP